MKILNEERPHFSASQLTAYLQCPLLYYFQYELGIPWKTTPSAVAFGDSVHIALKMMNSSRMNGSPINKDEVEDIFIREWTAHVEKGAIAWQKPEESAELLVKG